MLAWQHDEDRFRVSVNLSALDFKRPDFIDRLSRILAQTRFPADRLELEITEGILMVENEQLHKTLDDLKDFGVALSVDDFGTGYSSLRYLKNFPLTRVKIDSSFIQNVDSDHSNASITRSIITMAHGLGMKVIAEGVETKAERDFLASEECDEIQGYYFSRDLGVDELTAFYKENKIGDSTR